jgi:3-hydroxyisobutyrate dehydrogenase-like beta-hydroxyacid dehydrogenase
MKIACIGLGHVGEALATQLIKCGHEIRIQTHSSARWSGCLRAVWHR